MLASAAVFLVGGAPAGAGIGDYSTLYLSGASSTTAGLSNSRTLVVSAGPGTPSTAPTLTSDSSGTGLTGTYSYEYTIVDPTGGETAPSPVSSLLTVSAKSIDVSGLPAGTHIRLYRTCSCSSALYYRVADLTPGSSTPQVVDNAPDVSTDVPANLLPQTQNKPSGTTLGYFEFAPGVPLATTAATTMPVPSPAFTGKGWVVDAPGRVSIPSGPWTFTTKLKGTGNATNTAHLVIGMWVVDDTGAVVGSPLIDPLSTGENTTANIATTAGTTNPIVTTIASVPAVTLATNQHLYVQFWRRQTVATASTTTTLFAYDGIAKITHPTGNGFPNVPTLTAVAARTNNTTPLLSATFSDPDAADTGTLSFQLCSDSACYTVLQSGSSSSGIANGANGSWTPAALAEGTYYWHAQSTDSAANVSGWSATSTFVVDTTPPGSPTIGAPASAARVKNPQLNATFVDSDPTDSGAVNFQVCTMPACSSAVAGVSSATVIGGAAVSWTPTGLSDGTYYWRAQDQDVAGNVSAWSAAQSFVLDTNPPGVPALSGPADASYLGAIPALGGIFSSTDTGDSGTVSFQVCSDAACLTVQTIGTSAGGLANGATGTWTPGSLADGLHYWRASAQDAAGNLSGWSATHSFTLDTTAPAVPPLGSTAARTKTTPQLSATFSDPPATDSGTLAFRLCSTATCSTVLQTTTVSGVANNASANWTPTSLAEGTYYWRVRATDTAGNKSAWSAASSFVVDTTPPGLPAFVSPANGGRVKSVQLNATFVDSDSTDSGTVTFQLCSDAACTLSLSSSTSSTVAGGAAVSWSPTGLADGTYYWRLSGLDVAGNQGAWTATHSFVLDTNPPGVPALGGPADASYLGAVPTLGAIFSSSDVGDSGTVSFQVCSDNGCSSVVQGGSSASGLVSGATGSWTPGALADGTYYWRAQSTDAAGNQSTWSATHSFTIDATAPAVPTLGSTAARTKTTPQLSANFSDPPATDNGTVSFRLCANISCSSVLQSTTSSSIANNATANWTPATVGEGTYYWQARATDTAGNVSAWSASSSFVVDTTPPGLPAFVSPANGGRVKSVQLNATFVDSDSSDSGTVTFQLCSDPACTLSLSSSTSGTVAGGAAVSWSPGLADGTYYWRLSGLDVAGNQGAWTATHSFVLDTNPPGVPALGGPADASYLGAVPALGAIFSSSDVGDSGTVSFQVCSDNGCSAVVQSGSSASGLVSGATGCWTPGALADGTYYWRAQSTDAAGNQSTWSATHSFTIDATPPAVPTLGSTAARTKTTPQLSANFSDPPASDNGTLTFQVCATSGCGSLLQTATSSSVANNATANWTPSSLADGKYYWRVRATDTAGNVSAWSASSSFVVDTTPPGLPAFVSPANGARVNTVQLNATFVDSDSTDSGTVTFQLCSDAGCSSVLVSSSSATVSGGTAVSWSPAGLADGTYYWRLRGDDVAGNQGAWTAARSFVLDTNPPAVPALTTPADDSFVGSVPVLGATFASSDTGDTGTLSYQVCTDAACSSVLQTGSSPGSIASGVSGGWTPSALADGEYYWRAQAQDAAGNQSAWSATRSFTLDTARPAAPGLAGPDNALLVNVWPTLTATYSDSSGGSGSGSVAFELCTTAACTTTIASSTVGSDAAGATASWTPGARPDGTYYWRVQSTDSAGNLSGWSATRSFTFDDTPPAVPVPTVASGVTVGTVSQLTARVVDPGATGGSARLLIALCSDPACTVTITTGYSTDVPGGTVAGWQTPALSDGVYYWRSLAEDEAGNQSQWSAVLSFVVDTSVPNTPEAGGPAAGAVVNSARLSGTPADASAGASLEFQVCSDAACAQSVASGVAADAGSGAAPSWTPANLSDGLYFWRVRALDAAGNASAWTAPKSFVLDQTPPSMPRGLTAKVTGKTLTLRWLPPAHAVNLTGYTLLVNGKRTRVLNAKTHSVKIKLRRIETRWFAVAALDAAGNISLPTKQVGPRTPSDATGARRPPSP